MCCRGRGRRAYEAAPRRAVVVRDEDTVNDGQPTMNRSTTSKIRTSLGAAAAAAAATTTMQMAPPVRWFR